MTVQPTRPRFRIEGRRLVHVTARPGDRLATGATIMWSGGVPALCGVTVGRERAETTTDPATCRDCKRSIP